MMGIGTIPYSFYLAYKARKNPSLRSLNLRRMVIMPVFPLAVVMFNGMRAERQMSEISQKYFGHLSDNDLDNFEMYYLMKKS